MDMDQRQYHGRSYFVPTESTKKTSLSQYSKQNFAKTLPTVRAKTHTEYEWNKFMGTTQDLSVSEGIRPIAFLDPNPQFHVPQGGATLQTARRLGTCTATLKNAPYQDPAKYWKSMRTVRHREKGRRRESEPADMNARRPQTMTRRQEVEALVPKIAIRPFTTVFHQPTLMSERREALRSLSLASHNLPGDTYYKEGRTMKAEKLISREQIIRRREAKPRVIATSHSLPTLHRKGGKRVAIADGY